MPLNVKSSLLAKKNNLKIISFWCYFLFMSFIMLTVFANSTRFFYFISGVPALFVAAWAVVRATLADAR